ncbi:MAG: aminotransferase class I/II-fold pyridoxal phosphate-dependent enzyme [Marivita sp.]|uniref:DegT/DnrJ/EryC1/StrS family aminotransferase n=1 Tax=Marivita sp. TaxID=2003365 RepID=UPI0025B94791|nr:aminotransferase class I/II-fold pyridoxal phosphate-dependent enzyme [Marivita sp.]MCI5109254.1 aminotransferase class I/II-fold pyridoxal phosphate-dependent enzyme [Marivita sp.]
MQPFTGSFTQQEPIADDAIAAAVEVLRSGRLHRYNTVGDELGPVAELEKAYAAYQAAAYCLACTSGGYAMSTALRALGIVVGDRVLTNAFTLAPVPGAIAAVGAEAVLVEITPDLVIDLDDLDSKITDSAPKAMLLSNMRGHLCDMEALMAVLNHHGVPLIEDCAHTMGASWNGRKSGSFGIAGCFSTQTYKHMNSGEGGFLTSDDPELMARAIMLSGSYMLYDRHGAAPSSDVFTDIRLDTPNMSGRMDNLRAAILLPQLATLETNIDRWNDRHDLIANRLREVAGVYVPNRPSQERYVGSSFQFLMPDVSTETVQQVVAGAKALGVELKWFGAASPVGFTSNHKSWRYVTPQDLPRTDAILSGLLDMRIPLTFSLEDCAHVADIIVHAVGQALQKGAA